MTTDDALALAATRLADLVDRCQLYGPADAARGAVREVRAALSALASAEADAILLEIESCRTTCPACDGNCPNGCARCNGWGYVMVGTARAAAAPVAAGGANAELGAEDRDILILDTWTGAACRFVPMTANGERVLEALRSALTGRESEAR